MTKGQTLFVAL